MIEKIEFLEKIINDFAQSQLDNANEKFRVRHNYDLRDTDNPDHLVFKSWEVEGDELTINYKEVTPHDCPYGIELTFPLLKLITQNPSVKA